MNSSSGNSSFISLVVGKQVLLLDLLLHTAIVVSTVDSLDEPGFPALVHTVRCQCNLTLIATLLVTYTSVHCVHITVAFVKLLLAALVYTFMGCIAQPNKT